MAKRAQSVTALYKSDYYYYFFLANKQVIIKDKHFSSSLAWPPYGGFAPVIHGGDLPSDRGGVAPQNFDCGGDRPRFPREVGAYEVVVTT